MRATHPTTDETTERTIPWTRVLGLAAVLLTAGLMVAAGSATADHAGDTILVDDDGDQAFESIQAAIDHASAGDTVVVAPGTYAEALTVDVPNLTLCSTVEGGTDCQPTPNETIIHVLGEYSPAVSIDADGVTVQGFFVNVAGAGVAIDASDASQPQIVDNRIETGVPDGQFGEIAATNPQQRDHWLDPFTEETLTGTSLEEIAQARADDDGFLTARPVTDGENHVGLFYEGEAPQAAHDMAEDAEAPQIRVYEDEGAPQTLVHENMIEDIGDHRVLTPTDFHGAVPEKYEGSIRPGALTSQGSAGCTANWIWTTADTGEEISTGDEVYIGTAGHCIATAQTFNNKDEVQSWDLPFRVCVENCDFVEEDGGTIGTGGGVATWLEIADDPADVHFARGWDPAPSAGSETQAGDDFAIVRVPQSLWAAVEPSMPHWEGVQGDTQQALGDAAVQYGYGLGTGAFYPTQPRAGVYGTNFSPDEINYFGAAAPGDSGSAAALGIPDTDRVLEGAEATGLVTHTGAGTGGTAFGTSVQGAIDDVSEFGVRDWPSEDPIRVVQEDEQVELPVSAPPLSPENVDAVDVSTTSDARIQVSWSLADGSAPADSYEVYDADSATLIDTVSDTSYVDASVTDGDTRCYEIVAVNEEGASDPSATDCATATLLDAVPIPAPTVTAIDRENGNDVTVVWDEPELPRPDSQEIVGYQVAWGEDDDLHTWATYVDDESQVDTSPVIERPSVVENRLRTFFYFDEGTEPVYEVRALVDDTQEGQERFSQATRDSTVVTQSDPVWKQAQRTDDARSSTYAGGAIETPSVPDLLDLGADVTATPLIADLTGDGANEVLVAQDAGLDDTAVDVVAYGWSDAGFEEVWRQSFTSSDETTEAFTQPAIGDFDGDDSDEVAVLVNHFTDAQAGSLNIAELHLLEGATGETIATDANAISVGYDEPLRVIEDGHEGRDLLVSANNQGAQGEYATQLKGFALDGGIDTVFEVGVSTSPMSTGPIVLTDVAREDPTVALGVGPSVHVCEADIAQGGGSCEAVADLPTDVTGLSSGFLNATATSSIVAHAQDTIAVVLPDEGIVGTTQPSEEVWNQPALADVDWGELQGAQRDRAGLDEMIGAAYNEYVDDLNEVGDLFIHQLRAGEPQQIGHLERGGMGADSAEVPQHPVVADVNGDDRLEILLADASGTIQAIDPWQLTDGDSRPATLWQANLGQAIQAPLAVGDVTGDGDVNVLAVTAGGQLGVVDHITDASDDLVGVDISTTSQARVADNAITAHGDETNSLGVRASGAGAPGATVASNTIDVSATGVYAGSGSTGMLIEDNEIHVEADWCSTDKLDTGADAPHRAVCNKPNVRGVQVDDAVTVRGNTITSDTVVLDTEDGEVEATGTWGVNVLGTDATIEDNILSGWGVAGVIVWGDDARIQDNTFTNNTVGVHTSSDPGATEILDNDFENHAWAIRFAGSAPGAQAVELRENDLAENAHALWLDNDGMQIDARLNDWGVYEASLVDARIQDDGQDNTVLTVPFQLADGSAEPGLVRIQGQAPSYLTIEAALDAADVGDTVLVPASADAVDPSVRETVLALDTDDVTVCGSVRGSAACTSEIGAGHQQLSRAEWADAPGLGSGEAVLFDAAGTDDHRSTSYFPPDDARFSDIDRFAFDYYLEEGTCDEVDLFATVAIDETPDNETDSRDSLVQVEPAFDACEEGEWVHVDLFEDDATWSYDGKTGYDAVKDHLAAEDHKIHATNVVQLDEQTVGYVDNRVVSDVVLGERDDVACGGAGGPEAEEACRQATAVERTVLDANGQGSQTVTLAAAGTTLADLTVKNTDRPGDDTGTVLLDADDTSLTGSHVVGNHPHEDGTVWGDEIGVQVDDADGYTVADNTVEQWSNMGIYVSGASAGDGAIAGNEIRENTNHAIYVSGDAPDTTVEITDNEVGLHHASALRLANFDRAHVVRGNDFSGAMEQAVLVTDDNNDRTLDLRGNHWGLVREELIRERVNDAGDHEILVVPYLDEEGDQHPPKPQVHCFTEDGEGTVTLSPVDETLSFQDAVDLALPDACLDRDDNGDVHRTIVLGTDVEEYRGATINTETTVLSDTGTARAQTDGVVAGGARIQAQNGAPAIEIVEGSLDTSIEGVSVQGEPVGADGIVVAGAEGPIAIEDARIGVREAHVSRGLVVEDTPNVRVTSSVFLSGQPAIEATRADDLTVEGSSIAAAPLNAPETTPEADGIRVTDSVGVTVDDNTLHGAQAGDSTAIRLTNVEDAAVTANLVEGSATGIAIADSPSAIVEDNIVFATSALSDTIGLRLADGAGHALARNLFTGTSTGIQIDGTPGVTSQQDQVHLASTGIQVTSLTADAADAPQLEAHNASLATTTTPLSLDESTQGLELAMQCNDWGAYQTDLIEARISDGGSDNTVTYQPWTSATADPSSDCLVPPDAEFTADPTTATRLDDIAFTDESEPGSRPIVDWSWDFGDGAENSDQHPTHSYDEVGEFIAVLTVEDTDGMVSRATEKITVENLAPEISDVEDRTLHHSEDLSIAVTATDEEDDSIQLSAYEAGSDPQALPDNAAFADSGDGVGSLTWDPAPDQADTYGLTFEADDGQPSNNLDTTAAQVTIENPAPVLEGVPDQVSGAETRELEISVFAEETDADTLDDLRAEGLPDGATFTVDTGEDGVPNEGTLTWTPGIGDAGNYQVTFHAEGPGHQVTESTSIDIGEEVAPPDLTLSGPSEAPEEAEATVTAEATVSDGAPWDPVEWSVTAHGVYVFPDSELKFELFDDEVTVDPNDGNQVAWTGTMPVDADRVEVTFHADDGLGPATATHTIDVQLHPDVTSSPPTEISTDFETPQPIHGEALVFSTEAVDEDGSLQSVTVQPSEGVDPLQMTLAGDGSWTATLDETSSPTTLDEAYPTPDTYTATFTAVDDEGLVTEQTRTIMVLENSPPEVEVTPDEIRGVADDEDGLRTSLRGDATNPPQRTFLLEDEDFEWVLDGTTIATGKRAAPSLPVGEHTITLEVTDPYGATGTASVDVYVQGFIAANGTLDNADEQIDEDTYRYAAGTSLLERIEGTARVLTDQRVGAQDAAVTVNATYYGAQENSVGLEYARQTVQTNVTGHAPFDLAQQLFGQANEQSVASLPGYHEIAISASWEDPRDVPTEQPGLTDLYSDEHTIGVTVGPPMPGDVSDGGDGDGSAADALNARAEASGACYWGDQGAGDSAVVFVAEQPEASLPEPQNVQDAVAACLEAPQHTNVPSGGSHLRVTASTLDDATVVTVSSVPVTDVATFDSDTHETSVEGEGACYYEDAGARDEGSMSLGGEEPVAVDPPAVESIVQAVEACLTAASQGQTPDGGSVLKVDVQVVEGALGVSVDTVPLSDAAAGGS